ncbi:hypothetical protein [Streptomyces mayteni]
MALPSEIATCVVCRDLAQVYWSVAPDRTDPDRSKESAIFDEFHEIEISMEWGLHLQEDHPFVLGPVNGCPNCQKVLQILSAPFSPPGETLRHPDGRRGLHPSQAHFAKHLLQQLRDIDA